MSKRSLEDGGKRERANAAKAANARERNIAQQYLNAGPNISNLARAAYHWWNSVPILGGQDETGKILVTGEAPNPGMRSPKAIASYERDAELVNDYIHDIYTGIKSVDTKKIKSILTKRPNFAEFVEGAKTKISRLKEYANGKASDSGQNFKSDMEGTIYVQRDGNVILAETNDKGNRVLTTAGFENPYGNPNKLIADVDAAAKSGDISLLADKNGSLSINSSPLYNIHLERALNNPNHKGFTIEPTGTMTLNDMGGYNYQGAPIPQIVTQRLERTTKDKLTRRYKALQESYNKRNPDAPIDFGEEPVSYVNGTWIVPSFRTIKKKNGGSIHIAPSKRGTFTAAATKHGMGVQEFASRVLRNKDSYSPAMVKKANFARKASKWNH